MRDIKLGPKRRFEKFNEKWGMFSFNQVLNVNSGRDYKHLNMGSIPVYGTGGLMLHVDDKLSENDSIGIGRKGTIDKPQLLKAPFWTVDTLFFMTPHNNMDLYFLFSKSQTIDWRQMDESTGVPSLSKNTIEKIQINIPCLKEQQKIGNFFKHLDQMISLEQRKLEKTKALKSAYLAEMFPAEGERIPKRRFSGFSGDWEERSFFENIRRTIDFRGRTPKKIGLGWSDTGYLALSALNVKNGYIDFRADGHYGNQELYDKWMNGSELKKGQVLFTTEAPMGNVAQVPDNRGYILSQRTISFDVDPQKITNDFLATLLRSDRTFMTLSNLSSGGTAKGVSQRSLEQLKVLVPKKLKEQQAIGDFFKKLDESITNQQQKLNKLKAMKQAYLEEMFV